MAPDLPFDLASSVAVAAAVELAVAATVFVPADVCAIVSVAVASVGVLADVAVAISEMAQQPLDFVEVSETEKDLGDSVSAAVSVPKTYLLPWQEEHFLVAFAY